MRAGLFIGLISIVFSSSYSQTRLLNPQRFDKTALSSEWVHVKPVKDATDQFSSAPLFNSKKSHPLSALKKIRVPAGKDPIAFCNELRRSGRYEYADPILQYFPLSDPSDPLISNQYYLSNIKAFEAWEITTGDDDITIGIIDSGLDMDHEDMINNLWTNEADPVDGIDNDENGYVDDFQGYDFADNDNDPNLERGNHGMIVGGIAGASTNNGRGIAGVGYNTKVAALKGFRSSDGISSGLYEAIVYAADNGIDVLNLSWGRMGTPLQSEQEIINYAVLEKNLVVVAAAGNEGGKATEQERWYPASYDNVLSVAASDANDQKSAGSTFNYDVDLIAPGVAMFSTFGNNGYGDGGPGTSYASPQVAAAAALVKDRFPDLTGLQIMELLRSTSDDIYDVGSNQQYDGKLGKGRLNIFKALSTSSVKSLRSVSASQSASQSELIFFGDTVNLEGTLVNFMANINDPFISVASPLNQFEVIRDFSEIQPLGTMDSADYNFQVILNENIEPEEVIEIRLDFADGSYQDFQFLDFETAPSFVDFGNNQLSLTLASNGNMGFEEYDSRGSGFLYGLDTLLRYGGILLATSADSVSDNIISDYQTLARDQDFSTDTHYKLFHHQSANHFGFSRFTDSIHPLTIEQSSYAWDDQDFLLIRYRIINTSNDPISNLSFGAFMDWDLGSNKDENRVGYNDSLSFMMVSEPAGTQWTATQVIGGDSLLFRAIDVGSNNENASDLNGGFTDAMKYNLLSQLKPGAGTEGNGNDVAVLQGATIDQILPFGEANVSVIYAISATEDDLLNTLSKAKNKLEQVVTKPRVLETFFTCNGTSTLLDPQSGTNFELFADPLGENLIATDSVLEVTNITSDTIFYVRNTDNLYHSEIFEIRLRLIEDIARFSSSTDTLYLDNPTTNVITFTDESLGAVSWLWNFGNGSSSTIQNPRVSFSEPGELAVSLSVQSAEGCADTFTKTIVVANRPQAPQVATLTTCPGGDVTISDATADRLHIFSFAGQRTPTLSGQNLVIEGIGKDTTIYMSGVYNSFESLRVPLTIDVLEVPGSIATQPDTTNSDHKLLLFATNIDQETALTWLLDGVEAGSTDTIAIDAVAGSVNVTLQLTHENGCTVTLSEEVKISTSPIPFQADLTACASDSVVINPSNGEYFGFYEDAELQNLIKKGKTLKTNSHDKIYIAGLDDGLPGRPVEVIIDRETLETEIMHSSRPVGARYEVRLSAESNSELQSFEWFLNGQLIESIPDPIIFLSSPVNEIVLRSTNIVGCSALDILLLDFTPPLSVTRTTDLQIFPNPTTGLVTILHPNPLRYELYQLDGSLVYRENDNTHSVQMDDLQKGVYILKVYLTEGDVISHQIVLN